MEVRRLVWRLLQKSSLEMVVAQARVGALKVVRGTRYKLRLILLKLVFGQNYHQSIVELRCATLLVSEMH